MTDRDEPKPVKISLPSATDSAEHRRFIRLCKALATENRGPGEILDRSKWFDRAELGDLYNQPTLAAAAHTLIDLVEQGWTLLITKGAPFLAPPPQHPAPVQ